MDKAKAIAALTTLLISACVGLVIAMVYGVYCGAFAEPVEWLDLLCIWWWSSVLIAFASATGERLFHLTWVQGLTLRRCKKQISEIVSNVWERISKFLQRE